MAVQAFAVAENFGSSSYRVAPLAQPNYAALRTDSGLVRHDLMEQLDLSATRLQASFNTRFVDVTTGGPQKERVGVYLSWCLPRTYRAGITATKSAAGDHREARVRAGYSATNENADDSDLQVGEQPQIAVVYVQLMLDLVPSGA
jgi:hypothetical protein